MMKRLAGAGILCFVSAIANAQPTPAQDGTQGTAARVIPQGVDADTASANPVDEAEIQRAMSADRAAPVQGGSTAAASVSAPPPQAPAPPIPDAAGTTSGRGFQSLNPDVSATIDLAAGWFSDGDGTVKSGDDPQSTGVKVQEVELALQQVVDPYFRADVFLTIPNLSGLEVEEAFLTTTNLPGNFQAKAGIFRAGLGRQNAQHLHLQDFSRRPALNAQLLGIDGLRAPGIEVNWLTPDIPFFLVFSASAFSVEPAEIDQPLQTFGGGTRDNLAYVAAARAFFPLSEATSLYAGLSYARGKTSQSASDATAVPMSAPGHTLYDGRDDNLYGADLYLKWKPANQARTYASLAWQTEYFVRQIPKLVIDGIARPELEGGLYSQVVMQAHRRWYLGIRGELMGIPRGDNIQREYAGAMSITWALSEFSRIRLYGESRWGRPFLPLDRVPHDRRAAGALFLQLEATIGAHGAHPF
jgi:hypothetical protein